MQDVGTVRMIEWLSIGLRVPPPREQAATRVAGAIVDGTLASLAVGAWMTDGDIPLATTTPVGASSYAPDLAAIYAEYSGPIHTYAYHLLNNVEDADDVVQEVFIRAYGHLAQLRDPAKL